MTKGKTCFAQTLVPFGLLLTDIIFFHLLYNCHRKSQELHLSTCIQLPITKHPSRKVMNFRHLLGRDAIEEVLFHGILQCLKKS